MKSKVSSKNPSLNGWYQPRVPAILIAAFALAVAAAAEQPPHHVVPAVTAGLQPLERLAATNRLNLAIELPLRNPDQLEQLLHQLSDPASPHFRHYLTPEQFTERFGPTESDYQAVIAFAKANGLPPTTRHSNRMLLDVNGSVADVERAMHLKMHIYQHPSEARTFYAPDAEPTMDLPVGVLSVSGLDNYSRPRPRFVQTQLNQAQKAAPNAGSGPSGNYMGKDFRAAYAPDTTLTGSGQTVGLLQFDGYTASDITYYENKAGLSSVTLSNVLLDGYGGQPTGDGGEVEVSLDIEMSISMAPGLSKIIVYEAGPNGLWHDILNRMATDNLAKQLSCSWYEPYLGADPVAEQIFQQMAAQGQSFFCACGDYDAYTGPMPFPDDSPHITQVGGTTLSTSTAGGSWLSERVWNWGNGVGGAGGISTSYAIPYWQTNISMTANQGSKTMRNIPDVALTADNVYVRADGRDFTGVGGTSCASPLWAGFAALVNQQAAMSGHPTVGFINPALDTIGSSPTYTTSFHDITIGDNTSPSSPTRFYAVAGYDLCTGWGTPSGQRLINALANPDPLGLQPGAGFTAVGGSGGPFTVTSESFVLTNSGTNSLTWSLINTSAWLAVSPTGGALAAGGSDSTPVVSLSVGAYSLPIGTYSNTVVFSNVTSGVGHNYQFTLQIVPSVPPGIVTPPANQWAVVGSNASFSVTANGTPPLNYQWQFNSTNINGATNASWTLTNAGLSDGGVYTVTVTNTHGSTNAAATLAVGYAPSIMAQPQSLGVIESSNAMFSVTASGTAPLSYQWYLYSVPLAQGTNSTLTVSNVQAANSGWYSVAVSSPFGSVLSSNATLTIDLIPTIRTQPQSQSAGVGNNVTFSVGASGSSLPLPVIASGTLQLWLRADAGVVTNSAGLVSQWQDQSGNANHAFQSNPNLQPSLVYPAGIGSNAAVRFNGIQNNVNGSYLFAPGTVNVPNGMTAFTLYNAFSATNKENTLWDIGIPDQFGANRIAMITTGDLHFSFWAHDFSAPFIVPTNTYRIRVDSLDTNLDTLNMLDATADSATNFTLPVSGAITPEPGYYLGGLDSSIGPYVGSSRNFNGDIAELMCYQGCLSQVDQLAVLNYLQQKYYQVYSANGLSYQWQYDGTNIAGATNATLTLTNVQFTNAGPYTVTISNLLGATASSNAMLTVGYAPSITAQPQDQEVVQGSNAMFSVTATGTAPLSYQWYFDGAVLPQDTNSILTMTNVQVTDNGSYSVCVSSPFGLAVSSNAVLAVELLPVIVTEPESETVLVGTNVTFSVGVVTAGNGATLPTVTSGTLQLWLKGDAGVVVNTAGLVSQWQDQSGNANHASQSDTNLQPSRVYPTGIGGNAAVRFNGIQNNVNGSYLFAPGTVDIPNAMTAFTLYNAFSATNAENMLWDIGIPAQFGANRNDTIAGGDLMFSFWSYNFGAPFIVPTNTYRIWIDRLDTNMDTLNMFDATAASATNFTMSASGGVTPEAGYYVGGINSSVGPYVGSSRNFNGDIAELIFYSGYLSEADRLAVLSYLEQKYFQTGGSGISYQWQFDGTNIAGATNTTLTLTNVQITNDGVYTVTISNLVGATTSSNAMLTVGYMPSITTQPQNQEVAQGSNAVFSVTGAGTAPLSYQWFYDGSVLPQDTNSTLTLTDVQTSNSGSYSVVVSSPFGSIQSSNATLTVDLLPIILSQPQSETVLVGTNVIFSVAVAGAGGGTTLPTVTSGTLQLWLKGDAGVVANSAGLVSQWQDQSGNANHASQSNTNLQPALVYPAAIGGNAAVRFNGIQNNVNGSYLFAPGTVNIHNAMTAFTLYNAFSTTNAENMLWNIGIPAQFGANRNDTIVNGDMFFSLWNYNYGAPFIVPTNTYRIWIDRLNTNLDTLNMFDATADSATNFTMSVSGAITPQPGYYVGGINSSAGPYVGSSRNFNGDIAELICYSGYLSETDRLAVLGYLEAKYFQTGAGALSYQWQYDGTNMANATNATLTLTNVQITNNGVYTVIVTDLIGATTSSNAVLAVGYAPSIATQPQSQEVAQGSNVMFSVTAAGTTPLSYQWYFDGSVLPQDTNSTLALTNVQTTNSGSYSVVASSPFGSIPSSNATLTVDLSPTIFGQPQSQTVGGGTNVTFSVTTTPSLPMVTSGTLQLWLKGDAGVVTNSAGLVSQWQDQSSNANHATQATANQQPLLVHPAGIGGRAAVRFNGLQSSSYGNYLVGAGIVNVPNAMTAFTVYNDFVATNLENIIWDIGVPNQHGANRISMITAGDMHFSFWSYDYSAAFIVPTNTYRVRIDRLDTNVGTLNMFDVTAASTNQFTMSVSGALTPGAGYYIGGLNLSLPGAGTGRNAGGDIAEWICYKGYLSETDRLAVLNYLEQKYFQSGAGGLTYQWQFDGTNIAGATNASLTLTNVQATNSGIYTVSVSNGVAFVTSSNAILTVDFPPAITAQPASQSVESNCATTFNISASSDVPMGYQWWQDSLPLAAQTNSTLTIPSVLASNFGNYTVVVTNMFGATTSAVAVLALAAPPVANPYTVLRFGGGGVRINAADLVSNDVVASNDVLTVMSVGFTSSAGGAVFLSSPWIYYAPPAGGATTDSFTYTLNDGHCGITVGAVTVQIKSDNVQPARFAIANMANGSFQLSCDAVPGYGYHIEYSDSLTPPNWQVLTNATVNFFGVLQFTDSSATNAPARFYRVVCP